MQGGWVQIGYYVGSWHIASRDRCPLFEVLRPSP